MKRGMDACKAGGVTVPPYIEQVGWVHWNLERGRETEGERERERARCKRMNSFKRPSCHGYREMDEWMTSRRRWGEGVWNWFGGVARGGVCHWIILCRRVSWSCIPRCLRWTGSPGKTDLSLSPFSEEKADFEGDGERVRRCVCVSVCAPLVLITSLHVLATWESN